MTSNTSSFSIVMHCMKWCPVLPKWRMSCTSGAWADQRGTKCSSAFHTFSKRCALNSLNSSTFIFVFQAFVRAGGAGTEDRPSRWRTDQKRHSVSHRLEGWSPRCPVARSFGLSKQCEAYFGIGPGGPARLACAWSDTGTDSPVQSKAQSLCSGSEAGLSR